METLHFFSHESRVSLELPVGWEELSEAEHQVIYSYEIADEGEEAGSWLSNPRFMIKLFPARSREVEALERASASHLKANSEQLHQIRHDKAEVDGHSGILDIFTCKDAESGQMVTQLQAFVLIDNVLFSFTGITQKEHQDAFIPTFEDALRSARFIFE